MNEDIADLILAAYHEAGHAVVAMALGVPVESLSIWPGVGGFCEVNVDTMPPLAAATALAAGNAGAEVYREHLISRTAGRNVELASREMVAMDVLRQNALASPGAVLRIGMEAMRQRA